MSNPKQVTVSGQIVTGRGVIEICSLSAYDQNAFADIYDGIYADGVSEATHLWKISAPKNDYNDSSILNIPFSKGVFAIIAGSGAGVFCTVR